MLKTPIHIYDDVLIDPPVVIIWPGVTIGWGAVAGSRVVDIKDVSEDCIVAGILARIIRRVSE